MAVMRMSKVYRRICTKVYNPAEFESLQADVAESIALLERMWLAREPGAGSGEQGKRERGVGIVVRNPEIDKFHQK
jgi:hypothetical protein